MTSQWMTSQWMTMNGYAPLAALATAWLLTMSAGCGEGTFDGSADTQDVETTQNLDRACAQGSTVKGIRR